jgi:hypothetical protein
LYKAPVSIQLNPGFKSEGVQAFETEREQKSVHRKGISIELLAIDEVTLFIRFNMWLPQA